MNPIQPRRVIDLLGNGAINIIFILLEQTLNTLCSFVPLKFSLSRSCERPEYLRPSPLSWKRQIPFSSAICLILALFSPQAAISASSLPRFPPQPPPPTPLFVFLLISLCPYSIASHLSAHPSEASSLPSHQMYPLPPFTNGNPQRFPGPNHWCQFRAAPKRTRCPICIPPSPTPTTPSSTASTPQDIPHSQTFLRRVNRVDAA